MQVAHTVSLNLARKWRSKTFDEIVGQDLAVRMLKNSLYLGHYFPVYLFSGQRGCGKTSAARIFAAAVNCAQLADFKKQPKQHAVPCLVCPSCVMMAQGKHPDFFEIDAASYTGVDTIRQIVEASSLLPLVGAKKIYLIDEAHMLSKAAFNALLKVLEEPPHSVLFILATTDQQKILETVRSRCFQLFFKAIDTPALEKHLAAVCTAEKIGFDADGLQLIIQESEGSARDALNLIEQVRFSSNGVTRRTVLQVLGHVDDEALLAIFSALVNQTPAQMLRTIAQLNLERYSPEHVWTRFNALVRAAVWLKHGVSPAAFANHEARIKQVIKPVSWSLLRTIMQTLSDNETVFFKTTEKYALLEMILLTLCGKNNGSDSDTSGSSSAPQMPEVEALAVHTDDAEYEDDEEEDSDMPDDSDDAAHFKRVVHAIQELNDPLLASIFKQGTFVSFDTTTAVVTIRFSAALLFFKEWLDSSATVWMPLLQKQYGAAVTLNAIFDGARDVVVPAVKMPDSAKATYGKPVSTTVEHKQPTPVKKQESRVFTPPADRYTRKVLAPMPRNAHVVDVTDATQWPVAHMLINHFPGTVYEIRENS